MEQAGANKATVRVLSMTEGLNAETRAKLESDRRRAGHRLQDALRLLYQTQKICLEAGIPFTVIKSLDAMPDIGHDVDLLVGKNLTVVQSKLLKEFQCNPVTLTFCDRQAGKFSTFIHGFDSDFELYTRVSQLGEEYYPEELIIKRRLESTLPQGITYLCSPEDTLLIACIHTMYRHGKIRLSDLKIASIALKSNLDLGYVFRTVNSAGIERGFAVFIMILGNMCEALLDEDLVPPPVRHHAHRILLSDLLLRVIIKSLKMKFPLRIPVRLTVLLFLYKSAADLSHARVGSSARSALAPVLLVLDKLIPFRLQKATSVRIW